MLNDTTQCIRLDSNQRSLYLRLRTLPLSHCAPQYDLCVCGERGGGVVEWNPKEWDNSHDKYHSLLHGLAHNSFTDRSKAVLLLWILFVICVLRLPLIYCLVCSMQPCGHVLGKG